MNGLLIEGNVDRNGLRPDKNGFGANLDWSDGVNSLFVLVIDFNIFSFF